MLSYYWAVFVIVKKVAVNLYCICIVVHNGHPPAFAAGTN